MVPDLGVFRKGAAPGRPREAEDPGWIHILVDVSGTALEASIAVDPSAGRGNPWVL